jgi:nucleotide-binding universal stress UspA family protein
MFQHILVPLDGSILAEAALPATQFLARLGSGRVTLLHVIEQDAPATIHGERHLTRAAEAQSYLEAICRQVFADEMRVASHVHSAATSDVARGIVAHQQELACDLIVLCTHGRSGLKRLLIGSIAQQVVASGSAPVLLIRPSGEREPATFVCHTLFAPVDGDPVHERGLDLALELARATGARLHLLTVVPTVGTLAGRQATMGRFMPGTTRAMLELAEEELRAYLQQQVERIQGQGMVASAELRYGDSAAAIVAVADEADVSVIVLGTHGKAGAEAFWAHSVGARVQAQTRRPLLLVPVKSTEREAAST